MNALLSLGYSLLTTNLTAALEIVDPYCGFFHTEVYGRPALALDLMEEFRAVIVDSLVLMLVNKKMLSPKDFNTNSGGVYLNGAGRKVFFKQYSERLTTTAHHPLANCSLNYQKMFELQARQLVKVIQGEVTTYAPFQSEIK